MKEKVDLSGVTETMLVPLYSRALEAERKNPQFIDETAVKVMDSLGYDFKKKFNDENEPFTLFNELFNMIELYKNSDDNARSRLLAYMREFSKR